MGAHAGAEAGAGGGAAGAGAAGVTEGVADADVTIESPPQWLTVAKVLQQLGKQHPHASCNVLREMAAVLGIGGMGTGQERRPT